MRGSNSILKSSKEAICLIFFLVFPIQQIYVLPLEQSQQLKKGGKSTSLTLYIQYTYIYEFQMTIRTVYTIHYTVYNAENYLLSIKESIIHCHLSFIQGGGAPHPLNTPQRPNSDIFCQHIYKERTRTRTHLSLSLYQLFESRKI